MHEKYESEEQYGLWVLVLDQFIFQFIHAYNGAIIRTYILDNISSVLSNGKQDKSENVSNLSYS